MPSSGLGVRSQGMESFCESVLLMVAITDPVESALVRFSRVISTSRVTMMLRPTQLSLMMGQNTGSDAQIVARWTSTADSTIDVAPYQLGSNVG